MNKELITKELVENHLSFSNYIGGLPVEEFEFSYQEKWNVGQHLDHIIKSVTSIN